MSIVANAVSKLTEVAKVAEIYKVDSILSISLVFFLFESLAQRFDALTHRDF